MKLNNKELEELLVINEQAKINGVEINKWKFTK